MYKVFVVEDDDNIRDMLLYALNSAGFSSEGFSGGESFYDALKKSNPSLIMLDIMLPGDDGITILKKLKKWDDKKHIPVIMLTAKTMEIDRIRGLDLGADDYIIKPFSVLEVISRIRAVLRRCVIDTKPTEMRYKNVHLYLDKRSVLVNEVEVNLTYKEFELLHFLMANEGIVLSRNKLLEHVWGFDYGGESRTVDMHIKTLRQKLGEDGNIIKTVRNVGYKIGG